MEALYASIVALQEVDKLDTFTVHQLADGDLATEVTHKYVVVSLIVIYCRAEQDEKYYLHKIREVNQSYPWSWIALSTIYQAALQRYPPSLRPVPAQWNWRYLSLAQLRSHFLECE